MEYKGITTENVWKNGNWYTNFSIDNELILVIEWRGPCSEDNIKAVIDKQIVPFI